MHRDSSSWIRSTWLPVVVALSVRLAFLVIHSAPAIAGDAELYHGVAQNLADGEGYSLGGEPFGNREPGYILLVAVLYAIFGATPMAVFIFHAILGAAACGLVALIGERLANRGVGIVAGLLLAVSPSFLGYTDVVLTEVFSLFIVTAATLMLLKIIDHPSSWRLTIGLGLLLGYGTLTRSNFIVLALGMPVFLAVARLKPRVLLKISASVISILLLALVPWVLRNAHEFDRFIPSRVGSWEIFWSGSYIPWNGEWRGYVPPLTDIEEGLTQLEADEKLMELTIDNIKRDPVGVARIWARKPFLMWPKSDASLFPARPEPGDWRYVALALQHLAWVLSLALALVGAWAHRHSRGVRVILAVLLIATLSFLPVNPERRYTVPFYPLVYVLTALGIHAMVSRLRMQELPRYRSRREGLVPSAQRDDGVAPGEGAR